MADALFGRFWKASLSSSPRLQQIELDRILYIEGLKDYVKIHVEDEAHPVLSLLSLKSLEEQLPAERFVRVHRSYIVQPAKIRTIERNRIVFGKEYIPISDNFRQAFFDFLSTPLADAQRREIAFPAINSVFCNSARPNR